MSRSILTITACLSLSAFGCGASDGSQSPVEGDTPAPVVDTAVEGVEGLEGLKAGLDAPPAVEGPRLSATHSFEVGGTEYHLVQVGQGDFSLIAQASTQVPRMPHQVLLEEHGHLTMLELLLALAPDQEPDSRLVDYHDVQAELLGRDDLSVRRVEFSAPPLDKVSGGNCQTIAEAFVDQLPGVSRYDSGWENASLLYQSDYTKDAEAITLCNPLGFSIGYRFGWAYSPYPFNYFDDQEMPSGSWAAVYGPVVSNWRSHGVNFWGLGGGSVLIGWALGD